MYVLQRFRELMMVATAASLRRRYVGFMVLLLICYCIVSQYGSDYNQSQTLPVQNYVIGWEFNRSRNATDYVLPEDVTTLLTTSICSRDYPPRVLLIVCSSIENFALRTAIRETWASMAFEKFNISVAFLMGVSQDGQINERIQRENEAYDDVIVEDFRDTYNNLTIKSLMLLKWVKNNCNSTNYVMKTDDDVYINMKNLAQLINSTPEAYSDSVLCGRLLCNSKPIVDPTNKWYMPAYLYSEELYPNYLSGYGYVMSIRIALSLYEEAFSVPIIHMEDVFLTGICARRIGTVPMRHTSFFQRSAPNLQCSVEDEYVIIHSHQITEDDMYNIHKVQAMCESLKKVKQKRTYFDWLFHPSIAARRAFDPTVTSRGPGSYSKSCQT